VIGRRTPDGVELTDSESFARYLLEGEGVAVVHGTAFGQDPHFRVSYATATELLEEAGRRIIRACQALS
jgi:aspartate aminotransferase